jgi:transcriptional regulator with XRE-family HTH domain
MPLTMGEWMRSRRIAAGLTQEELSVRLGVDQTWVGRVENGVRKTMFSPNEVRRVSEALSTTPRDFVEALGFLEHGAVDDEMVEARAFAKMVAEVEASALPKDVKEFIAHAIQFARRASADV